MSALAFSPNGAWLAYQPAHSPLEATPGIVNVIDLRKHARVAQLEASATRAGVLFAADGRTLLAANVTRIDSSGTFGLRGWSSNATGAACATSAARKCRPARSGRTRSTKAWPRTRTTATSSSARWRTAALVWSMPLVPPGLDAIVDDAAMQLDLVAFARRGELVLSYESPVSGSAPGTLSVSAPRRRRDGRDVRRPRSQRARRGARRR